MKDFLIKVNQDTDKNRRSRWNTHRKHVSGLFHEIFLKKDQFDNIGIFGAGNCDDLDLDYIASKCNQLYLFDYDENSVKKGIEKFLPITRNKIKIIELDVTGLNAINFYDTLSSLIQGNEDHKKISKYIISTANNLTGFSNTKVLDLINKMDVVAISAIYTQLFYNWALELLKSYDESTKAYKKILDSIIYLRNKIVISFHDSVFRLCHKESYAITWTDVLSVLPQHISIINNSFNEMFKLIGKEGYQAAVIGIKDFMERIEKPNEEKTNFLMRKWPWDFFDNKQYLVIGICGKVR